MELLYQIVISSGTGLAVLYPEMKFSWTFREIGNLQSATAVYRIVLLTIIVPATIKIVLWHFRDREEQDRVVFRHLYPTSRKSTGKHGVRGLWSRSDWSPVRGFVLYLYVGVVARVTVGAALLSLAPVGTLGFFGSQGCPGECLWSDFCVGRTAAVPEGILRLSCCHLH